MNTSYGHHLLPRADTVWKLAFTYRLFRHFLTHISRMGYRLFLQTWTPIWTSNSLNCECTLAHTHWTWKLLTPRVRDERMCSSGAPTADALLNVFHGFPLLSIWRLWPWLLLFFYTTQITWLTQIFRMIWQTYTLSLFDKELLNKD